MQNILETVRVLTHSLQAVFSVHRCCRGEILSAYPAVIQYYSVVLPVLVNWVHSAPLLLPEAIISGMEKQLDRAFLSQQKTQLFTVRTRARSKATIQQMGSSIFQMANS